MPDWRDDRGSVLLLVPVAIVVVLLLTGLVVDSTGAFLAERRLADAAAGAANDAVAAALDQQSVRADGVVRLDADRVCRVVRASLAARADPLVDQVLARSPCPVVVGPDGRSVEVALEATHPPLFGLDLPGGGSGHQVGARRRAVLAG